MATKIKGKAFQYFSEVALRNESIFVESCAGYIKGDRKSQEVIRQGINLFLQDGINIAAEMNSEELLKADGYVSSKKDIRSHTLDSIKMHGFILIELNASELRKLPLNHLSAARLRTVLPSGPIYVSFITFGEGVVYLLWAKDVTSREWQIVHASLVCM